MNFWQTILISFISGGFAGSIVTYFLNKKFDIFRRTMEERRKKYSEISELLKGLYNTATPEEQKEAKEKIPTYYRSLQTWASDDVLIKLVELMKALGLDQKIVDEKYKELIIAMRTDLLGKTKMKSEDIFVIGKII